MNKTALLKAYADNLSNSDCRNHYLGYARHFLDNSGGLDRASIDEYIATLRKGRSAGTVNFAFGVIRRLFAVNNLPWEYRRGEAPVIGQRDEYRPQLSPHIIEMMVAAAKSGDLLTHEQCFLALFTIYGLRRAEVARLQPRDINLKSGSIYVATVKSGRERYHLIPPEIKPYVAAHDFTQRYALATLSKVFKRILIKSGAGELRRRRLGWHAVRRAVYHGIVDAGVNPMAAGKFMRWKAATGDMAMPARYYGNVVVDLGQTEPLLDEAKSDEQVFEKHPFLPFWREDGD